MENTQLGGTPGATPDIIHSEKGALGALLQNKMFLVGSFLVALALVGGISFFYQQKGGQTAPALAYTLVQDKISQSAPISVELPENISSVNFDPGQSVRFSPEIKGKWEVPAVPPTKTYRFLPEEKLAVGAYYLATLDTPELKLEKMFSIDKDPSVLAVFPKAETEVNEYSKITIMFSRPMVALSTLSETADVLPPVVITPTTEGRYKWITTRTLQFIPATRLMRASNYIVEVREGFRSEDGVAVLPFTHTFTTRTLKYAYGASTNSSVEFSHSEPVRIYFNQPIDLEKTRGLVTLSTTANDASPSAYAPIPFVAAYGTRMEYDDKSGEQKTLTDRSVLEIYPQADTHGRKYLWDFDSRVNFVIIGGVPLEGGVPFQSQLTRNIHIQEVITGMSAQSPRSNVVRPEIFDPTGTLTFTMSEPIDLDASNISGKGITKIAYGEECRQSENGEEVEYSGSDCEKVPDKKNIIVSFSAEAFGLGESSSVIFKKLVNTEGITLTTSPLTRSFTTYKQFAIVKTNPEGGATNGNLRTLTLCSTNPIAEPAPDDFYKKIVANMMLGRWDWGRSYLVSNNSYGNEICPVGTFHTTIYYGLVPKFAYEFTLDLDDHFGQHLTKELRFTTEDADPMAKGFNHLQPTVVMTPPERTIFTYGLDFMGELDMTVCKVSAQTMLKYRLFPPDITADADTLGCLEKKTKHVTLPESYATRKYFQYDLHEAYPETIGNYVLVFTNPGYRRITHKWDGNKEVTTLGAQLYEKTYVTVTRMAVASKQVERVSEGYRWRRDQDASIPSQFMNKKWPTNLYWVSDFRSLTGVPGATVTQYAKKDQSLTKLSSKNTDAEGIAEIASESDVVGAIVTIGIDSAIISNSTDALSYVSSAEPSRKEYIYTDRPIYRPGDEVHIKGISRIGYDARYEAPTGSTTLSIRDARYETARTEEVHFSGNGTYEMTFRLDSKASLGYYQVSSQSGGYGSFQVEEYVAPQFKVDVTPDKEEYVSGDTAKLNIAAQYYFGVPVASGDVEYRIVSQDYYFDRYQDAYFNFGGGWYGNDNGWYGDRFVTSGKLKLAKDGTATLDQELNIDKLFKGDYRKQSKLLTLYVTVKNENGQSVSSQKSIILHRGSFYAGLTMDDYFFITGKTGVVRVKTVDIKGKPIAQDDLTLTLNRVEWKSYKRQEVDGNFYYRTELVRTKVLETNVDTDKSGDGSYQFIAPEAGEYEFALSGKDKAGNSITAEYDLYVAGKGRVEVRPTNNATLELVSNKTNVEVGDTARFVIKSPYPRAKALVTISRGYVYERKIIDLTSQLTEYQFVVTDQEIPNVSAQVLILSPDPEVKYGELFFSVGTKNKKLDISVTPNRKTYLPGEEVSLSITVKDSAGTPVPDTELSLAVVDMSVLALVGNPKKDPVDFFYNGEPLTIRTAANVRNVLSVAEIPTGTKGGSGGGGDDLDKKKRGVFRDTGYWNGVVITDAKGQASVRFTLPDNLTEWQVESVGITKSTKTGAGYGTFTTRKQIMAVPLKPRFILPGDTFAIGGTIFNETAEPQDLKVSVLAPTLTLSGATDIAVRIEPHTSISVSFPAFAPESVTEGAHAFTLSAKNEKLEDVVTSTFPIERNNTYEFTSTAGRVTDASWKEQVYLPANVVADRGSLSISVSATMATVVDSAIRGMLIYPYECSEQTGSKLRTIAIVKQNAVLFGTTTALLPPQVALGNRTYTIDEIVQIGLAKLYQNEGPDGGVSYYPNTPPNQWLTRSVLETYIDLREAGYAVDEGKMNLAAQYVFNWINYPQANTSLSNQDIILGSYVLSRMKDAHWQSTGVRTKLVGYANDKDLVHRGLSTSALAYLTMLSSKGQFGTFVTDRMFTEFENRSVIDARGTTLQTNGEIPYQFYENSVTNTALAIKAFAETKHDSPLLEGYLRAIKNSRTHDGGWASTHNSLTVIDAMTQYLKWKNEQNAKMHIAVTLDGDDLLTAEYSKKNILDTFATTVPMSMLSRGVGQQVKFTKKNMGIGNDAYYYDMSLRYYLPTDAIAPRDEGIAVERSFYRTDDTEFTTPVGSAAQGEVLRGRVIIRVPTSRFHVAIEDFIPAGVEIVNQRFATEDQSLGNTEEGRRSRFMGDKDDRSWLGRGLAQILSFGGTNAGPKTDTDGVVSDDMYANRNTATQMLYPTAIESHDDRIFAYVSELRQGEYVYEYFVRALIPGTYQHLPLVVSELYTPENFGRTRGDIFTVTKKSD